MVLDERGPGGAGPSGLESIFIRAVFAGHFRDAEAIGGVPFIFPAFLSGEVIGVCFPVSNRFLGFPIGYGDAEAAVRNRVLDSVAQRVIQLDLEDAGLDHDLERLDIELGDDLLDQLELLRRRRNQQRVVLLVDRDAQLGAEDRRGTSGPGLGFGQADESSKSLCPMISMTASLCWPCGRAKRSEPAASQNISTRNAVRSL